MHYIRFDHLSTLPMGSTPNDSAALRQDWIEWVRRGTTEANISLVLHGDKAVRQTVRARLLGQAKHIQRGAENYGD